MIKAGAIFGVRASISVAGEHSKKFRRCAPTLAESPDRHCMYICIRSISDPLRIFDLFLLIQAKKIAENGREYMRNNVTPANIYCYYYRAITVSNL